MSYFWNFPLYQVFFPLYTSKEEKSEVMPIHYGYYELNNTTYTQHIFILLPRNSWCCPSRPV